MLKADGSIAVHSDAKAYKPLNWMSPPCTIARARRRDRRREPEGRDAAGRAARGAARPRASSSATTPASRRTASRPSSRSCIAARVDALRDDFTLVRREYPTDIGPVDLLCRDGDGRAVVVEVKRVGEIAGVEQLIRYQERLDLDTRLAPTPRHVRRDPHQAAGARCSPRAAASTASRSTSTTCASTTPHASSCSDPEGPSPVTAHPPRRGPGRRRPLLRRPPSHRRRRAAVGRARAVLHRRLRVHRPRVGPGRGHRGGLASSSTDSMRGLEDWDFPIEFAAIDGDNVVVKWLQVLPGAGADGSRYHAVRLVDDGLRGDGKFRYQEDLLNMVHVLDDLQGRAAGARARASRCRRPSRTGTSPARPESVRRGRHPRLGARPPATPPSRPVGRRGARRPRPRDRDPPIIDGELFVGAPHLPQLRPGRRSAGSATPALSFTCSKVLAERGSTVPMPSKPPSPPGARS